MSNPQKTSVQELDWLKERILFLEESNHRYVSILDLLAGSGDFQADLNRDKNDITIFRVTFNQIRRLFTFRCMAFLTTTDDNCFEMAECDDPSFRGLLEQEVDAKIMDGTFAWAINQNHAVLAPAVGGGQTLVFHVLATRSRIRGMFVGLLPDIRTHFDIPSLNALSLILLNTAYALENATLYAMLRDQMKKVTDRTHELQKAQLQAEAANLAKSAFLATMSHELRTPLNAIIGFTDVVLAKNFGPLNDTQEEYLGYVLQSSRHLLDVINDILDLSKIEADKMELELSEVTLPALLANSLIMIKEQAHKRGIRIRKEIAPDLPDTIMADERKLKQIMFNLLSNAVKFTSSGGSITLAARNVAYDEDFPDFVGIQLGKDDKKEQDYVMVIVSDTGIGLKQEDLERIFDPFEQADNSDTRAFEGTGLGLALTRKLIIMHKGVIWAESLGQGEGSTFRFILPVINSGCMPRVDDV